MYLITDKDSSISFWLINDGSVVWSYRPRLPRTDSSDNLLGVGEGTTACTVSENGAQSLSIVRCFLWDTDIFDAINTPVHHDPNQAKS